MSRGNPQEQRSTVNNIRPMGGHQAAGAGAYLHKAPIEPGLKAYRHVRNQGINIDLSASRSRDFLCRERETQSRLGTRCIQGHKLVPVLSPNRDNKTSLWSVLYRNDTRSAEAELRV